MASSTTSKHASPLIRPLKSAKEQYQVHPLYMSEFAMEIYAVVILAILMRRFWVLYGIALVILSHIADILSAWFRHVKDAREIRIFKSWLIWWTRIGLDFATNAVEGDFVHVLVAGSLNFWNVIGKRLTVNWFGNIATKGRAKVLRQAKENLEQLTMSYNNFTGNGS